MKKNRFLLPAFLTLSILMSLSGTVFAQKALSGNSQSVKPCSGEKFVMPASIAANDAAFSRYLSIVSATGKERNKVFSEFSNEHKAEVVRFQYAIQFAKRPSLTKEQSDFLLDALSKISADVFDKTDPEKIRAANTAAQEMETRGLAIFSRKDAFDILSGLQADKHEDARLLHRYAALLESGMMQRRKILHDMPMAEMTGIWKTQLAFHLAASRLTEEQQRFIVDFIPSIQMILETSANSSKEERSAYLANLESDIFKVFSRTEGYAIFMEVGIQRKVADPAEDSLIRPDCNCRWYCSEDNQSCGGTCRVVSYCGPLDTSDCTGKCTVS